MVTSPVKKITILYELATVVYGRSIRCGNQSIYYNGYQSNPKKNCYIIMATSPTKKNSLYYMNWQPLYMVGVLGVVTSLYIL